MAWLFLIIASFGEIFGVMCIQLYLRKKTLIRLIFIVLVFGLGFFFLSLALKTIPLGVGYAIWTGLGATGALLIGALFFKESLNYKQLFFLVCIISGVVGLKIVSI